MNFEILGEIHGVETIAVGRAKEIDEGKVKLVSSEELDRRVQALLK